MSKEKLFLAKVASPLFIIATSALILREAFKKPKTDKDKTDKK
jgi:hypothetical protein